MQSAYKHAQKAMRFYQRVTGEEQPTEDPDNWLLLMVTGDEVLGNKNFPRLRLVMNTAATSDDTGSVGMLMSLMGSLFSDEHHENNLPGMIRYTVVQHGVDLSPYLAECEAMSE